MSKSKTRKYLASWDNNGLEVVFDLTEEESRCREEEKSAILTILGEPDVDFPKTHPLGFDHWFNNIIHVLTMRAMANTPRHYEIYAINTSGDITKEDIEALFSESPQNAAELFRSRGVKIYSDRADPNLIKII